MAFDVEGARKEGYTEEEIASYLDTKKDTTIPKFSVSSKQFDVQGALNEGYTEKEIAEHLESKGLATPKKNNTKSPLGLAFNAIREVPEIAKGLWETGKTAGMLMNPSYRDAQGQTGSDRAIAMGKGLVNKLGNVGSQIGRDVYDKGLPQAFTDYAAQAPQSIYNAAYERPLTAAMTVLPGIGGVGKVAKMAGLEKTANVLDKVSTLGIGGRSLKPIDTQINNIIDSGITKGIRPSVAGKGNYKQMEGYTNKARDAVKSIVENKENLSFVDETGQAAARLPETLSETSQAIGQTKRAIFNKYDQMDQAAGKMGAGVDLNPIAKELDNIASNPVVVTERPELARYAADRAEAYRLQGRYTATQSQDAIAHLNQSLDAFYKNPTYENASRASMDSMVVNNLRKGLDNAINSLGGAGYQELKKQYGSLSAIEKDVSHRAIVDMRKNMKGLIDFSDIFSGSEVVRGVLTMNPSTIATGATAKAISAAYKYINSPNRIIKKMFANVDELLPRGSKRASYTTPNQRALTSGTPEGGHVSSINDLSGSSTVDASGRVRTGNYGGFAEEINSPELSGTMRGNYPASESPFLPATQGNQLPIPQGGVRSLYPPSESDYVASLFGESKGRRVNPAQSVRKPRLTEEQIRAILNAKGGSK